MFRRFRLHLGARLGVSFVGSLAGVALAAAPSGASVLNSVAQLPAGTAGAAQIADVSQDGRRVLIVTSDPASVWSVDASNGAVAQQDASRFAPLASQSPSGSYIAWIPRTSLTACPRQADVAAVGASTAPKKVTLPAAYAHSGMNAVAVADDGTLTIRVRRCQRFATRQDLAVLTAGPASSQLTLRFRLSPPNGSATSQDGRVFAGCTNASHHGRIRTARLSLIDSRAPGRVRTARLTYDTQNLVTCVASDAGTATISVVRKRPGKNKFKFVGVTIGRAGTHTFGVPVSLPKSRGLALALGAASPDGKQVITAFGSFDRHPKATVIQTTSGRHSRLFRVPAIANAVGAVAYPSTNTDAYRSFDSWDPFAPALVLTDEPSTVGIFNARTLTESPSMRVNRYGRIDPCFLPSGRVLFVGSPDGSAGASYSLAITNPARTRIEPIDTTQTGPISSASCEAVASTGQVLLSTPAGHVFSVAANTLDGSPLSTGT